MASDYPDFEGDKSGLYSMPEWASVEGIDIAFHVNGVDVAVAGAVALNYAVPVGSTLYIFYLTSRGMANLAADRDKLQILNTSIINTTTGAFHAFIGGNGGFYAAFSPPIVIPGGDTVNMSVSNEANHAMDLSANMGCVEI